MTRTIWLASYPKSGNTWLRMMLANLGTASPVDINDPALWHDLASSRAQFDDVLLIDSGLLTHDELDHFRSLLYEEMASAGRDAHDLRRDPGVRFVKVHDAYRRTATGRPLLAGRRGADGAILVLRDPRDVAVSLAHHLGADVDAAIAFLNDPDCELDGRTDRADRQLRQRLLDWSGFVASWLDQEDLPVHPVRYEDFHADAAGALAGLLAFAGNGATPEQIERAAQFAEFSRLKSQERRKGFAEAPTQGVPRPFFRRGEAGVWRSELAPDQVARIEARHAPMMLRLGYALSSV